MGSSVDSPPTSSVAVPLGARMGSSNTKVTDGVPRSETFTCASAGLASITRGASSSTPVLSSSAPSMR
jgi:hypothetical protein